MSRLVAPERKAIIIGMIGYAQSGKDTVGRKLMMSHGFQRLSFADILKLVAQNSNPTILDGNDARHLRELVASRGWDEAKKISDVREYLQNLGMAVRTYLGGDTWIEPIRRRLVENLQSAQSTVVTDVRFPNEAKLITDLGGYLFRVERPGVEPINGHASETALDGILTDYLLTNDSTVNELGKQVNGTIRHIEHRRLTDGN
jgi:hypothetical protein